MSELQRRYRLNIRGRIFESGTHIMAILNATPDSFFEESRAMGTDRAVLLAGAALADGAEVLDIGGQSTRPGCRPICAEEEERRVIPVVRALREAYPDAPLSVDTFYALVAEEAAKAGADMINDVSCLSDEDMAATILKYGLAVCVMHNRRKNSAADLMSDKLNGLKAACDKLTFAGVSEDKILLDGGIGFNLSAEEDRELLLRYGELIRSFDLPFLLGASRKSFLGGDVRDRLPATLETTALATKAGALFVRVHDVAENAAAIKAAKE